MSAPAGSGPHRLYVSGRAAVLDAIRAAIDQLAAGTGGALRVEGPAGSGRTRLLDHARSALEARGIDVVRDPPGARVSLTRLVVEHAPSDWSTRPLAVLVDDADLADAATRLAVRFAPPSLGSRPLLVIVTTLLHADLAPLARTATIGDLSPDDAAALAADLAAGAVPMDELQHLATRTTPLPLHLAETVSMWSRQGADRRSSWPEALWRGLPDLDLAVLSAAAVLGMRFHPDDVAELTSHPLGGVVDAFARAVTSGLLLDEGDELAFRHRVVRDAFSERMEPGTRTELIEAAFVLATRDAPRDADLPRTARLALDLGVEVPKAVLTDAVTLLSEQDVRAAAALAEQELRLTPGTGPATDEVAGRYVSSLLQSGQFDRAFAYLDAVGGSVGPSVAFSAAVLISPMYPGRARELARLGLRGAPLGRTERARLLAVDLVARTLVAEPVGDAELEEAAVAAARADDARSASLVRVARAVVELDRGDWTESLRQASLASDQHAVARAAPEWWLAGNFRVRVLSEIGRDEESAQVFTGLSAALEDAGRVMATPLLLVTFAAVQLARGELSRAEATARLAGWIAMRLDRPQLVELNATKVLAQLADYRGGTTDPSIASGRIPALPHDIERGVPGLDSLVVTSGRTTDETAVGAWHAWLTAADTGLADAVTTVGILADVADVVLRLRLLVAAHDEVRASRVLDRLQALAAVSRSDITAAAAVHARGLVGSRRADLVAAAEAYLAADRPVLAAWALEDVAARSDDPASAGAALRDAEQIWTRIGAEAQRHRVEVRLHDLGERVVRRPEARLGLGLTGGEERVARELVKGSTNAEIAAALVLSPNTVAVHLRRMYRKSGARSRAELIAFIRSGVARLQTASSAGSNH